MRKTRELTRKDLEDISTLEGKIHTNITKSEIEKLLRLYSNAVEYYEGKKNPIVSNYIAKIKEVMNSNRLQQIISKPKTPSPTLKSNKKTTKSEINLKTIPKNLDKFQLDFMSTMEKSLNLDTMRQEEKFQKRLALRCVKPIIPHTGSTTSPNLSDLFEQSKKEIIQISTAQAIEISKAIEDSLQTLASQEAGVLSSFQVEIEKVESQLGGINAMSKKIKLRLQEKREKELNEIRKQCEVKRQSIIDEIYYKFEKERTEKLNSLRMSVLEMIN